MANRSRPTLEQTVNTIIGEHMIKTADFTETKDEYLFGNIMTCPRITRKYVGFGFKNKQLEHKCKNKHCKSLRVVPHGNEIYGYICNHPNGIFVVELGGIPKCPKAIHWWDFSFGLSGLLVYALISSIIVGMVIWLTYLTTGEFFLW